MTPDEVKDVCEKLVTMTGKEARAWFNSMGINYRCAEYLRHLLGVTQKLKPPFSDEEKDVIRQKLEDGVKVEDISREHKVRVETLYLWMRKYGWEKKNRHDFWTEMKVRTLCAELKKGTQKKQIARQMNVPPHVIYSMVCRIKNREHVKKWIPILDKYGV